MEIVYDDSTLERVMKDLTSEHDRSLVRRGEPESADPARQFPRDAVEVDVDAVRDASGDVFIAALWNTLRKRACTRAIRRARYRASHSAPRYSPS